MLRLALSHRRAWSFPGAPLVPLRVAMDSAQRRAATLAREGGAGAYPGGVFGMFREAPQDRATRWIPDSPAALAPFRVRSVTDASASESRCRDESRHGYTTESGCTRVPVVGRVGTARRRFMRWRDGFNGLREGVETCGAWIAGYREDMGGGIAWNTREVFWGEPDSPPDEAEREAHDMARRAAEDEAEYDSAWQEGRAARDSWDEARGDLSAAVAAGRNMRNRCRELVAAARILARAAGQGHAKPGAWRAIMESARDESDRRHMNAASARAAWAKACDALRDAAPSRRDESSVADAWRDGASVSFDGGDSLLLAKLAPRSRGAT